LQECWGSRRDPDLLLRDRTAARAVEDFDAYVAPVYPAPEASSDVCVVDAGGSRSALARRALALSGPRRLNIPTGGVPQVVGAEPGASAEALANLGFELVALPIERVLVTLIVVRRFIDAILITGWRALPAFEVVSLLELEQVLGIVGVLGLRVRLEKGRFGA